MRAFLRPFDREVGNGEVGGQGAGVAEAGDALFDQCTDLGFHGFNGRFDGRALYGLEIVTPDARRRRRASGIASSGPCIKCRNAYPRIPAAASRCGAIGHMLTNEKHSHLYCCSGRRPRITQTLCSPGGSRKHQGEIVACPQATAEPGGHVQMQCNGDRNENP